MKRWTILFLVAAIAVLGLIGSAGSSQAKMPGANGRIAFWRLDPLGHGRTFTADPDGTNEQLLFGAADTEHPRWSPNGTEISMECDSCVAQGARATALIVNPDTGSLRTLPNPDPALDMGCSVWSSDGSRLACAVNVDTTDPSLWGLYTVRASDGGGLTKVTNIPGVPGDYAPDGKRLSFVGRDQNGQLRIYVIKLNGSGLTPITPPGMLLSDEIGGSWSPTGNKILFQARPASDHRSALWVVDADGSGLHQLPIPSCGGAFSDPMSIGCLDAVWSPDGTKIAFSRFTNPGSFTGAQANIYTVNPDGSGLTQVTHNGFKDFGPDWGSHRLA